MKTFVNVCMRFYLAIVLVAIIFDAFLHLQ